MKNYNSFKKEMEKKQRGVFLIALMLSLGFTLMAFEWSTFNVSYTSLEQIEEEELVYEETVEFEIERPKPPKKSPPEKEFNPLEDITPPKIVENLDQTPVIEQPVIASTDVSIIDPVEPTGEPVLIEDEGIIESVLINKQPEYPGGIEKMYEHLYKKVHHTTCSRQTGINQTLYVRFVIEKDGSITNVVIPRKLGCGLDEMCEDAVKSLSKWKPGERAGKKVRVRYTLPIKFTLK